MLDFLIFIAIVYLIAIEVIKAKAKAEAIKEIEEEELSVIRKRIRDNATKRNFESRVFEKRYKEVTGLETYTNFYFGEIVSAKGKDIFPVYKQANGLKSLSEALKHLERGKYA